MILKTCLISFLFQDIDYNLKIVNNFLGDYLSLINQREYNNKKRAVIKNLEKEIKKRHPRFNNTPNIVIRHKFSKLIKEIKKSPDVLIENITYYNLINVILGWENLVEQIPMLEKYNATNYPEYCKAVCNIGYEPQWYFGWNNYRANILITDEFKLYKTSSIKHSQSPISYNTQINNTPIERIRSDIQESKRLEQEAKNLVESLKYETNGNAFNILNSQLIKFIPSIEGMKIIENEINRRKILLEKDQLDKEHIKSKHNDTDEQFKNKPQKNFCTECGMKLNKEFNFCPNCGSKL